MMMPRMEVITSVERRRRWSREEKERLVAASFELDVSVSEVARSAVIHVWQLFRWRGFVRSGRCRFIAIGPGRDRSCIAVPHAVEAPSASPGRRRRKSGIIEIELGGRRCVRVDRDADVEALRHVLDALGSR